MLHVPCLEATPQETALPPGSIERLYVIPKETHPLKPRDTTRYDTPGWMMTTERWLQISTMNYGLEAREDCRPRDAGRGAGAKQGARARCCCRVPQSNQCSAQGSPGSCSYSPGTSAAPFFCWTMLLIAPMARMERISLHQSSYTGGGGKGSAESVHIAETLITSFLQLWTPPSP